MQTKASRLGRKTKRTPETQSRLFSALRDGCTRRAAAAFAGISEETLYTWIREFPEFSESLTRAEHEAEAGFTRVLKEAAQNGDWRAAESWLKRRRRDDWGDSLKQDVSVQDKRAEDLPDDELLRIASTDTTDLPTSRGA